VGRHRAGRDALGVGHLQLRQCLPDRAGVLSQLVLAQRQQRAHALDRHADLLQVPLVLGPRRQPRLAPADVEQRDDGLDDEVPTRSDLSCCS
jgi:hypothetical protein